MNDFLAERASAAVALLIVVLCRPQTWHSRYPSNKVSLSDVQEGGRPTPLQLRALLASQWGLAWCTAARVGRFS